LSCSTRGRLRTTRQGHQDYLKLSYSTTKYSGACRMDLPRPTTLVGTRTDYSVGPRTTRLVPHGTWWRGAQGLRWRSTRLGSYTCPVLWENS
jgi:hypothetical protein